MRQIFIFFVTLGIIIPSLFGQNFESYKTLVDTTITSKHLGFDKKITITVPFEWQKEINRDFPLIIIFDRQNQRSHNYMLNTIDYLTSNDQMPSSIVVSIESEQQYRYLETLHKASSKDGLALENEKFLFEDLIPLIENNYKASSFRLFIGHSRYGYFTSYLFHSRIKELNGVISISPFFTGENLDLTDSIYGLNNQQLNSKRYYYFGIGDDFPDDFIRMNSAIKTLNNKHLQSKGFHFKEADHNVTPGLTIGISLYEIFEDWSNIQSKYFSNEQKDLSIKTSLEKEILANYGVKLNFSIGVLNGKGWYFYNEKQYEKAIEAWRILMDSYPNFSEGYLYIIYAQIQLNSDYSQTFDKFKESLSKSNIYTEREKIELLENFENMTK